MARSAIHSVSPVAVVLAIIAGIIAMNPNLGWAVESSAMENFHFFRDTAGSERPDHGHGGRSVLEDLRPEGAKSCFSIFGVRIAGIANKRSNTSRK